MFISVSMTQTDALLTTVSISQICVGTRETDNLQRTVRTRPARRRVDSWPSGRACFRGPICGSGGGSSDRLEFPGLAPTDRSRGAHSERNRFPGVAGLARHADEAPRPRAI